MKIHFSKSLKEILSLSAEEARRLHRRVLGTGEILIAMIRQGDDNILFVLKESGVPLPDLQREIEAAIVFPNPIALIPAGSAVVFKKQLFGFLTFWDKAGIRLGRDAEKAIKVSVELALALKSSMVEPPHLLLSILKDKEGLVARVLDKYGMTYELAKERICQVL